MPALNEPRMAIAPTQNRTDEFRKAYAKFLKENDVDWFGIEMITHNQDFYAGTLDRYGFVNGNTVILDIKTTKTISGKHKKLYEAGQNLYRLAVKDRFDVDIEKLFILQLKEDETYKLIELPVDDELALACMSLHRATQKKRRRRKT